MELITRVSALVQSTPLGRKLARYIVCSVIIGLTPSYFQYQLNLASKADPGMIPTRIMALYVASLVGHKVFSYFNGLFMNDLGAQVKLRALGNGMEKYFLLSFQSRKSEPSIRFKRTLNGQAQAMASLVDWGLPTLLDLITSVIGTVYVFYRERLLTMLWVCVTLNLVLYLVHLRWLQHRYTNARNDWWDRSDELRSLEQSYLPQFEVGSRSIDALKKIDREMVLGQYHTFRLWRQINFHTQIPNMLPLIYFAITSRSIVQFMLLTYTFRQFTGSLNGVSRFWSQFQNHLLSIEKYDKLWKKDTVIFRPIPVNRPMPELIEIKQLEATQGKFRVTPHLSFTLPIRIRQGETILCTGKSGSGKTTLINGLLGKLPGVVLADGSGSVEEYYWQVSEFYQDIKERMSTRAITIRQLCDCLSMDEPLLKQCFEWCECLKWATRLPEERRKTRSKIQTTGSLLRKMFRMGTGMETEPEPVTSTRFRRQTVSGGKEEEKKSPSFLDRKIMGHHSGGEKTRFVLGLVLFWALRDRKRLLILDEPEQGSDPEIAYRILDNIRRVCRENRITLLVISHLERVGDRSLFTWDHRWRVSKGVVFNNNEQLA